MKKTSFNIVFDLGGVVLNWKPEEIIAKFFDDPAVRETVRAQILGHEDWIALDRGTLPWDEAVSRAAERTGLPETDVAEFLRRVPDELTPIPETVELIYRLKTEGHTLFCLSNMHASFMDHLEKAYSFWGVFTGIVISCRLHLCKPEPAIYSHLLETCRLNPLDTVFIDDTGANLATAALLGMKTVKFEDPIQCERRLRTLGI